MVDERAVTVGARLDMAAVAAHDDRRAPPAVDDEDRAVAATGVPINPSSTALRAVWIPVPSTVSGAQPTRSPAA